MVLSWNAWNHWEFGGLSRVSRLLEAGPWPLKPVPILLAYPLFLVLLTCEDPHRHTPASIELPATVPSAQQWAVSPQTVSQNKIFLLYIASAKYLVTMMRQISDIENWYQTWPCGSYIFWTGFQEKWVRLQSQYIIFWRRIWLCSAYVLKTWARLN